MDQARGIVAPMNIPAWRDGFALVERVGALLPGVPVRLHNDAVCFAAAEYWNGAAQGTRNALGMVVSTGIGGGLVLDGRLLHGTTGHAGHVGHIVVAPDGPPCGCGGRGCVEAIARGPALVAWARQHGWTGPQAAVDDGPALAADAAAGNPVAVAAYRRGGAAVGRMLAGLTAALELQVVVFGGGVAAAGALLLDPVRATYDTHARMPFQRSLRITTSSLPDAGLVGAAALFAAPQLTGPW
jgi:glucokinase